MRIAVTGHSGQVALALGEQAAGKGISVLPIGRPDFDLADPKNAVQLFGAVSPDAIVSAAAYTAVDLAESEPEVARRVNVDGAAAVATAAAELGVPLIHLSTDYVFDGAKPTPWLEGDETLPLGVYGATKLAGEQAVRAILPESVILRVAWVYSPFGKNFVKTMLRLADSQDVLRIVDDQIGNPTSAHDIADGILAVTANLLDRPRVRDLAGTFHMGAVGATSWAGFAEAIFSGCSARGRVPVAVKHIRTADYPTPARRPANSQLGSRKLKDVHGIALPEWRGSLEKVLDRLVGPRIDTGSTGRS
ncbi:MAG: dTDP-4-dehydrorhamnose reductase [Rhodopseudomonas sp.]|nr:dTDP-4-dehydrorhamnose reductase [Rhodopseudomonas sp.]